jgi:CubicO group peptidase (beta-lactamase class C family)
VTIDNRNLRSLRMRGGYGDSRYASEECPAIDSEFHLWNWASLILYWGQQRIIGSRRFAAVAPRMQEFVDKGEAAGVVTLIATKDRDHPPRAVGKTDLAKDRKMRTDDIFWIASMSKPITSVCIAILADDGKLSFDDPLAKHLPEFAGVMVSQNGETVKPSRPVTLRDVMTHTSGLGEMNNREPHLTLAETSKRLSQQPLRFQPGSRWAYSTAGMDVLGRVVEAASGMPFDQFLQKRVLDPLGMKDTSFWIAPEKESRWAHPIAGTRKPTSWKRPPSRIFTRRPRRTASVRRSAGPGFSRRPRTSPGFTR